jgi:hypothetical protein
MAESVFMLLSNPDSIREMGIIRYLTKIVLPYDAIIYITQAASNEMTGLNMSDAAQRGISAAELAGQRDRGRYTHTLRRHHREEMIRNAVLVISDMGISGLKLHRRVRSTQLHYLHEQVIRRKALAAYFAAIRICRMWSSLDATTTLRTMPG